MNNYEIQEMSDESQSEFQPSSLPYQSEMFNENSYYSDEDSDDPYNDDIDINKIRDEENTQKLRTNPIYEFSFDKLGK